MTTSSCPFCKESRRLLIQEWPVAQIIGWYRRDYRTDVAASFTGHETIKLYRCTACHLMYFDPMAAGGGDLYDHLPTPQVTLAVPRADFLYVFDQIAALRVTSLLDVGCGEGQFLRQASQACEVHGLEESERGKAALARLSIPTDELGRQYDLVTAIQVLEHVADAKGFLDFLVGKVKPGGYLFLSLPHPEFLLEKGCCVADLFPPNHVTMWSPAALDSIASHYGLEIVGRFRERLQYRDYSLILMARENNQTRHLGRSLKGRLISGYLKLIGRGFQTFFYDDQQPGHSHGILLKKP
jgi:2-polyprenyl-3-methyl-5-hydroxy-6-metoxy-1,4-benzoquinol methylase